MMTVGKKKTYIRYSIGFLVVMGIFTFYYAINGKTPIWEGMDGDGLTQHYASLAYWGQYLRSVIKNLITGNGLVLPEWNFSIGYGADIITTLHYYAIGDPLNIVAVLVPIKYTEILYIALVILRLYLAGFSFISFCHYRGRRGISVAMGAWIYVFAAYTIRIGIHYPFFFNVLIYFPLMLLGAEKLFKKEKPYVFILSVFISALSSFYFFYVECIFLVLYAVIRYISLYGKPRMATLLPLLGRFFAMAIIGTMMAAVILFPVLVTLFGSQRNAAENYIPPLYSLYYYVCSVLNPLSMYGCGYNNFMGYAASGVLGVFMLFVKKGRERYLKFGIILLFVFTLIPYIAHVLNGFSYVTNRWEWVLLLLVSYTFTTTFPWLFEMDQREKRKLFCAVMSYAIVCVVINVNILNVGNTSQIVGAVVILCLAVAIVCGYKGIFDKRRKCIVALLLLLFVNFGVNINVLNNPNFSTLPLEFTDAGSAYDKMVKEAPSKILKKEKVETVRYEQQTLEEKHNTNLLSGKLGTEFYFSLSNGYIGKFFQEMQLNFPYEMIYTNLNSRTALEALLSVNYFIAPNNYEKERPFLFSNDMASETVQGKKYTAYQTKNGLPLGYTYDRYISRLEYENMTALQKQQALLQGAVLEQDVSLPHTRVEFDDEDIPYEIVSAKGATFENNKIFVKEEKACVKIRLKKTVKDAELYASMQNVDFSPAASREQYTDKEWDDLPVIEKNKVKYADLLRSEKGDTANVWFKSGKASHCIMIRNARHDYYCGRTSFVANLGYNSIKKDTISLYFSQKGYYTFDRFSIHAQPVESLNRNIRDRGKETLENVKLGSDTVSGDIMVSGKKLLCMPIPYSRGWHAYVDGKEVDVLQVNTMMTGVMLEAGRHTIVFEYANPALRLGVICSGLGILIFIILLVVNKRRENRESKGLRMPKMKLRSGAQPGEDNVQDS